MRKSTTRLVGAMLVVALVAACTTSGTTPTSGSANTTVTSEGSDATTTTTAGSVPDGLPPIEGGEVITDPSQWPNSFSEAPALAALVAGGALPSVEERIGTHPLVIDPVHEIGTYGGEWRRGFTGPGDLFNGYRAASGRDTLLAWNYDTTELRPNLVRDWEISDDGRVTTLHLREGMRWSDGEPFTSADFEFWYQDMMLNTDLVAARPLLMTVNGKPVEVVTVDTYTVQFVSEDPYYLLPEVLAGQTQLGGQALQNHNGLGGYAPAHYLKQFHPAYVSESDLAQLVADAGLESWPALFKLRANWALNPEVPVVSPWKTVSPANSETWVLERNPYSIWVDSAGNQLPYIDRVVFTLAEDLEVLNLRAIGGEYSLQERHIDISKLPVLLENQERSGYRVHLDTASYGSDMFIKFNLSYAADEEVAGWISNPDFRRALALGIDRDQLNEIFWLGTGTPGSVVPEESNVLNPGAEYRKLWAVHDVDRANQMLDAIGLHDRDSQGFRVRTDGGGRLRLEVMTLGGQFLPFTSIMEAIKVQWEAIGIDVTVREVERSLAVERSAANEHQMCVWTNDGSEQLWFHPDHVFPYAVSQTCGGGPEYARWYITSGEGGVTPPESLQRVMELHRGSFSASESQRIAMGKELWATVADEVFAIGVVGLGPAINGVRVADVDLGNVPARQINSPAVGTPSNSYPMTFYFKNN